MAMYLCDTSLTGCKVDDSSGGQLQTRLLSGTVPAAFPSKHCCDLFDQTSCAALLVYTNKRARIRGTELGIHARSICAFYFDPWCKTCFLHKATSLASGWPTKKQCGLNSDLLLFLQLGTLICTYVIGIISFVYQSFLFSSKEGKRWE